jgi:lipoprotein-anchoring transpeptidase ErfK/SrfK
MSSKSIATAFYLSILLISTPNISNASSGLSLVAVNASNFNTQARSDTQPDPAMIKLQVWLDRLHYSVGVIDGFYGDNMRKAIKAFQQAEGIEVTTGVSEDTWSRLKNLTDDAAPMTVYTLSDEDVSVKLIDTIPQDYAEMAKLEGLFYTSRDEAFAEKFQMDIDLFKLLNGGADLSKPGTKIVVPALKDELPETKIERIVVSKSAGTLKGFDSAGKLIVQYPATVGSAQTPSPSGSVTVNAIAINPTYSYNPEVNFTQGNNTEALTLPPGPNGPVGNVWIDLSKPTYGIHGTPDPAAIDKTQSHGCVRLTNWDANELAQIVSRGATVEFAN